MPGSSKENTVAASMTPAAELSSMSRARIDKSLIVEIIKAPSNVPTLANRLARLPATIMLLSYSIMVRQQKYKYDLNALRVAGKGVAKRASVAQYAVLIESYSRRGRTCCHASFSPVSAYQ